MNCSIIIPAYNEDTTIYTLIDSISKNYSLPIIVVDDGSDIEIKVSALENTYVLRNDGNKGKGYSVLKGISYSSSLGFSHSIVLDADLQHDVNDIEKFLKTGEGDLVLGYRELASPMPIHRRLSNRLTSWFISKISGFKIKDSQCGFRMYKNSLLEKEDFKEKGFQFESEILLKLPKETKIRQIPIKLIYNDKKSHINKVKDTGRFIKLIFRHLIYGN